MTLIVILLQKITYTNYNSWQIMLGWHLVLVTLTLQFSFSIEVDISVHDTKYSF
jgi:hypothetical protein